MRRERSMNALRRNFTLPELEDGLNQLAEGALLQISARDYTRLFGANDVAAARLLHFAKGHACVASHADAAILFRKKFKVDVNVPRDAS
jgi:hypothetical protein